MMRKVGSKCGKDDEEFTLAELQSCLGPNTILLPHRSDIDLSALPHTQKVTFENKGDGIVKMTGTAPVEDSSHISAIQETWTLDLKNKTVNGRQQGGTVAIDMNNVSSETDLDQFIPSDETVFKILSGMGRPQKYANYALAIVLMVYFLTISSLIIHHFQHPTVD